MALVRADVRALDEVGVPDGHLALLLPDTAPRAAQTLLNRLVGRVHARAFRVDRSAVRLTPAIGVVALEPGVDPTEIESRADGDDARRRAARPPGEALAKEPGRAVAPRTPPQLDGPPPDAVPGPGSADRVPGCAALRVLGARSRGPGHHQHRLPSSWVRSSSRRRRSGSSASPRIAWRSRRKTPGGQYPPASAIIAAYLPNEADTVVETVEAFLRQDYNQLQVILAYNTPDDLPVEDGARSPSATLLRSHARRLEHVQGPERQRRTHSCHRHVRRGVRRRSPPGARLLPPRLAMAVERRRRRAGALRRAERADGFVQKLVREFEAIYGVAHPAGPGCTDSGSSAGRTATGEPRS